MASSYSTQLRLEEMANGENDTTWGTKTNTNLELLEAAIAGRAAVTHDDTANYTLTTANGSDDEARHMILNIGGALGAARNVVVPTQSKLYVVKNATTGGFAVTIKTTAGTGISVPNGKTMILFCDGTNVVNAIDYITSLTAGDLTVTGTSTLGNVAASGTLTSIGAQGYATGAGGAVTQSTSKSTAVTLNKVCGQITMNNEALAGGANVSFTLNNSTIAVGDVLLLSLDNSALTDNTYRVFVNSTGSGFAKISLQNYSGVSKSEAAIINFIVFKSVAA